MELTDWVRWIAIWFSGFCGGIALQYYREGKKLENLLAEQEKLREAIRKFDYYTKNPTQED